MKQTFVLEGDRKAVVDIPYSKLMGQQPTNQKVDQGKCCQKKFVMTGSCGNKGQDNYELKKWIEELQEAYDADVKQLKGQIKELESNRDKGRAEKDEIIIKIKAEFEAKTRQQDQIINTLRASQRSKDNEINRLIEERNVILRNKISEFKQTEYISRIAEQDQILRLREAQIKDLISKLQLSQMDRLRSDQQLSSSKAKWESQITKLTLELNEKTRLFSHQQSQLSYLSKLKEQESQKRASQYRYRVEQLERSLKDSEVEKEAKERTISSLSQTLKSQEQRIAKLQAQINSVRSENTRLSTEVFSLTQKLAESYHKITLLQDERGKLLIQIQQKNTQIESLKKDLASKQRVYEVKIERVIDGRERIAELQSIVAELEQQLKQYSEEKDILGEELKKKQNLIEQLHNTIFKLQAEISTLKSYIEKRQGTFKWVVERQIEKDIQISEIKPQTYKVSQIREYSRDSNQETANKVIAEQISYNIQQNLYNNFQEQITMQNSNRPT